MYIKRKSALIASLGDFIVDCNSKLYAQRKNDLYRSQKTNLSKYEAVIDPEKGIDLDSPALTLCFMPLTIPSKTRHSVIKPIFKKSKSRPSMKDLMSILNH